DAAGYYDDFEVNRVVEVEFNAKSRQSDLAAALESVVSRLLHHYKAAQEKLKTARAKDDVKAIEAAQNELNALVLFKHDMTAYQRMYAFLSQIFDYGNTAIEKRFIFYKRLLPLLEFGREREGIDLSKVILTHHTLKHQGKRTLSLIDGEYPKLKPLTESGSGSIQEKEKAYLYEIIARVNDLFDGDITENDRLIYVNNVIKGKLLESDILVQQAANNSKEQFSSSPDLNDELLNAIMDALAAHSTMSKQALGSEQVRNGLKETLLGPGQLYEMLRERYRQRV
ncbi:MAG: hypothetical protein KDF49_11005, partial [Nitrosomonas sp.]|nr:hypothetical protein [Nitrosomonas sp.]